jgi:hypothetical protein
MENEVKQHWAFFESDQDSTPERLVQELDVAEIVYRG